MPEVSTTAHIHIGHVSPTPNPAHRTYYKASQTNVKVEGFDVITAGDATACGDQVVGVSTKVFVGGKGVHRKGDATGSHGSWVANASSEGSSKVNAGG